MSARDLRTYEAIAGPALVEHGYRLAADGPPSVGDRVRIAALTGKYRGYRGVRRLAEQLGLRMPN